SGERANEQDREEEISDRSAAKLDNSRGNDAEHGGLQHIKRVYDLRELTVFHIEPAQKNHYRRARNDECETGENTSQNFSFEIADINRQLKRLRTRKHVTESHDFDESVFRQPMTLLDHVIEHHRDLRDRATDVHETEKEEIQKDFAPRRHRVAVRFPARRSLGGGGSILCARRAFVHTSKRLIERNRCLAFMISDYFLRPEFCST